MGHTDIWEYAPDTDLWTQKTDMPGAMRSGAAGFVLGDHIFIGGGDDDDGDYLADFWQYNPASDEWIEVAPIPVPRSVPFAFSIGNIAYVGAGMEGNGHINSVWSFQLTD